MSDTLKEVIEQVEEQTTEDKVVEPQATEGIQLGEPIQEDEPKHVEDEQEERKGGWSKRVDKLTQKVYKLQAELNAARRSQQEPQQKQGTGKPVRSDYDTDDEYLENLADYKAGVKFKEFSEQQQRTQSIAEYQNSVNATIEKYPDWHERLEDVDDIYIGPHINEAIIASDNKAEISYYLACNPNITRQISSMSPTKAAIRIGQIDAQLSSGKIEQEVQNKQKKQTSKAPPPINPVRPNGKVQKDPAKMTPEEWARSQGYLT